MGKYKNQLIKKISSNFASADLANRHGDNINKLRYLLLAINDITILIQGYLSGKIDYATTTDYADSLKDSAKRVNELIECSAE